MLPARRQLQAIYATFVLTGIATVLLGPLLPELARRYELDAAALAWLFPCQFAASALGSVLAGRFPDAAVRHGYLALAGGLWLLAFGGGPWCAPAFAAIGLGVGSVCTAANLVVARGEAENRGQRLALINFLWGLGAALSPIFFAQAQAALGFVGALALIGGLLAGGWLVLVLSGPATGQRADEKTAAIRPSAGLGELLPIALLFFLYVGAENAWGGWLVKVAAEQSGVPAPYWHASLYWTALLVGRGITPWVLGHLAETRWLWISIFCTLVGGVGLLVSPSRPALAAAAILTGFGLAAIFPLVVSLLTALTTERGRREAGWVFAFTGAGGSVLPWMVGMATSLTGGPLQDALWVPLAAMLVFAALLPKIIRSALRPLEARPG